MSGWVIADLVFQLGMGLLAGVGASYLYRTYRHRWFKPSKKQRELTLKRIEEAAKPDAVGLYIVHLETCPQTKCPEGWELIPDLFTLPDGKGAPACVVPRMSKGVPDDLPGHVDFLRRGETAKLLVSMTVPPPDDNDEQQQLSYKM